jgi:CheY-like chemotaxis protein
MATDCGVIRILTVDDRQDVTLMDLQMPEMNGIEAIIAIYSDFPNCAD